MKTCPVCNSTCFDDIDTCFGCMHRFEDDLFVGSEEATLAEPPQHLEIPLVTIEDRIEESCVESASFGDTGFESSNFEETSFEGARFIKPVFPGAVQPEPMRSEPMRAELVKTEPLRVEVKQVETTHAGAKHAKTERVETMQAEPEVLSFSKGDVRLAQNEARYELVISLQPVLAHA